GPVDERTLHALYARADVLVHPTRYEGSSLVTLEAMAHALPVVATRAGGIPDKVADGVTGLLVPRGDRTALAAALATLVADRGRRAAMGAGAPGGEGGGGRWPGPARVARERPRRRAARGLRAAPGGGGAMARAPAAMAAATLQGLALAVVVILGRPRGAWAAGLLASGTA